MDLKDIKNPSDIKHLTLKELKVLASDIRGFLVDSIAQTGGHMSPNLGVIELTLALHYVFDSPNDGLIFDVGHQAYTHKILTGRANQFDTLRQMDGLSGYINYKESQHDIWESGHAGSSLSALLGLIYAKKLKNETGESIAVIGDASITNGMAFEALNLLGSEKDKRGIIILNDNKMSISQSVGAVSKLLTQVRSMRTFVKMKRFWEKVLPKFMLNFLSRIKRATRSFFQTTNIFEDLGYMYIGPVDGHDLESLIKLLKRVRNLKKSVVIHVITQKGKGHKDAQDDMVGTFHGVSKHNDVKKPGISWSSMIAHTIEQLQSEVKTFVIMPAMTVGTNFSTFRDLYPDRFIDVGIAEEHAATMAASLAHQGIKVFFPIYSTFSQRAFDQILNDIARSNHHVVLGVDRAGLVGEDGSTHQGLFDVSMFNLMPNMKIVMPYDGQEAIDLLYYAFMNQEGPLVMRYPRGVVSYDVSQKMTYETIDVSWKVLEEGQDLYMISYGPSLDLLKKVKQTLKIDAAIINARFIKPMDEKMLDDILKTGKKIFVYEEASNSGSLYPQILKYMAKKGYHNPIIEMSITDQVVNHGAYEDVLAKLEMDEKGIIKKLKGFLS